MGPGTKRVRFAALWVALFGLGCAAWLVVVYPRTSGAPAPGSARIELSSESDVGRLAARLAEEGVIERPWLFAAYLRLIGADKRLRSGVIRLRRGLAPEEVARSVAMGFGPAQLRVTIPEGYTRFDVAARFQELGLADAREFLQATEDRSLLQSMGIPGESAEGYLFPDTYDIRESTSVRGIVRRLSARGKTQLKRSLQESPAGFTQLQADLGWSAHEVLVLASIVEKEAAFASERPMIAGVFLNRLRSRTFLPSRRLQADPTVSYGCLVAPDAARSCEGFDGAITRSMLADASNPYNTYRHSGLPPGPIANPGRAAIDAVLNPAAHRFFYFVVEGGGRHHFSRTLEAHDQAVQRYRATVR
ncbi:MAG: endolytic transglycosylase MltG [Myxococcota bacterium]